ncbi:membrane protein [Streptomyces griseoflavus Tu4000]|uniref:Membrane protein n=2 Tax=Streptomyces griseoflavus TaxID=35619 RepID=D9XZ37_9ACTN|nr:membrane protein [Streptomyces griseoflavus Tu4000]
MPDVDVLPGPDSIGIRWIRGGCRGEGWAMRGRVAMRSVAVLLPLVQVVLVLVAVAGGLSAADVATAAAGAALAACVVVLARSAPAVAPTRVRTAIRDRDRRTAFLPQRDPDAKGRTRPRAPGHVLPATAA